LLGEANDSVLDNTCSNNEIGIEFYATSNNVVNGNNCSENLYYGLVLSQESNSSHFFGNWFFGNGMGSVIFNYTGVSLNQDNLFNQDHGIITANVTTIHVGGTVQFSTWITDNATMSFQWDFKDGSANITSVNATHIFSTAGTFAVTVAITDANGNCFYETIAITVGELPGAPVVTASAGNGQVVLTWSAPDNGGPAILHYNVYEDGTNITSSVTITQTATGWTCTVSGLTNGKSYSFQVSAVNANGEGPLSAAQSATPTAPKTTPATPFGDSGIIALATLVGIAGVVASIESKRKRSSSP
jgi:parallel beta-helix repeat protein